LGVGVWGFGGGGIAPTPQPPIPNPHPQSPIIKKNFKIKKIVNYFLNNIIKKN